MRKNNSSPPMMQDFYKLKFAPNNPQKPKYPQIPPKNYLLAISKYGAQVLYLLWNMVPIQYKNNLEEFKRKRNIWKPTTCA